MLSSGSGEEVQGGSTLRGCSLRFSFAQESPSEPRPSLDPQGDTSYHQHRVTTTTRGFDEKSESLGNEFHKDVESILEVGSHTEMMLELFLCHDR